MSRVNKDLVKSLSDELGILEEKIPIIIDQLVKHPKFQKQLIGKIIENPWFYDAIVEKLSRDEFVRNKVIETFSSFCGRRSFIEGVLSGLFGATALGAVIGKSKADTYIVGRETDFFSPAVMPYSAIVYIDGSKVKAEDWKGKEIASGTAGVDDAAVIQSALDFLVDNGGVVTIKSGRYMIYNPITINNRFTVLAGEGIEATKLSLKKDLNDAMLKVQGVGAGTSNHVSQVVIKNMTIYGDNNSANGVLIKYAHECSLKKLRIAEFNGYGLKLQACWDSRFLEINVENCGSSSNYVLECMATSDIEYTNHCEFISCKFGSTKSGILGAAYLTQGTHAMKFIDCKFVTTTDDTYGVYIENQTGYAETRSLIFNGCHFTQDYFTGSTSIGLSIPHGKDITVVGCLFSGFGYGVKISSSVGRVTILGNLFLNPIGVSGGNRFTVNGNYFSGNTIALELSGKDIVVVGNIIHNSKENAIKITNIYYALIANNYIKNYSINSPGNYAAIHAYNLRNSVIANNLIQNIDYNGLYSIYVFGSDVHDNIIEGNQVNEQIYSTGLNTIVKRNLGYPTENSGTATFSGDGATTDFLIGNHGLVVTDPNKIVVKVTPVSADAIAASPCVGYCSDEDGDGAYESIRVKFASAPAAGTNNIVVTWEAQVV